VGSQLHVDSRTGTRKLAVAFSTSLHLSIGSTAQHLPRVTPADHIKINTFMQTHRSACCPRSLWHNTPQTIRRDRVTFRVLTLIPRPVAIKVLFFSLSKPNHRPPPSRSLPLNPQHCFYNPTLALIHTLFSMQTQSTTAQWIFVLCIFVLFYAFLCSMHFLCSMYL